jgi:hypothetical protein
MHDLLALRFVIAAPKPLELVENDFGAARIGVIYQVEKSVHRRLSGWSLGAGRRQAEARF